MLPICQLRTHQKPEGDMVWYAGILSRFKNLDIFQIHSQGIDKPHASIPALLFPLCVTRQRKRTLSDDGFRGGFAGDLLVGLMAPWHRRPGAAGWSDGYWRLCCTLLIGSKHFSQVDGHARLQRAATRAAHLLFVFCWSNSVTSNKPPIVHVARLGVVVT